MVKNLQKKQPVVVLVGHIDHGKSSILEKIKDLKVLEKESGGITQHISAYEIEEKGQKITFIDTPGHEAFSAMRARGADIADIALLVIAADEGVQSQTKEAIKHLKESNTPFIVVINKIDKQGVQPGKIKKQLVEEDIVVEDEGGEVPCVEISAKTGKGIDEALELVLLVTEMQELKTDSEAKQEGVVIESLLCPKRGVVVSLLIKKGVLKEGMFIATESACGKVKRIEGFTRKRMSEALPGQVVQVLGFKGLPLAGESFKICKDENAWQEWIGQEEVGETVDLQASEKCKEILTIILKTDVLGSIEPIKEMLVRLPREKVGLNLLQAKAGEINLSDVRMADTTEAVIIGFRVGASSLAIREAERKKIGIFKFDILYKLSEGVEKLMEEVLGPQKVRVNLAKLEILLVFKTDKSRQVIGARVLDGEIKKGDKIEIFRLENRSEKLESGKGIGGGKAISVQIDKKDVKKGKKGDEVGVLYEGDVIVQKGDIIAAYEIREKKLGLEE